MGDGVVGIAQAAVPDRLIDNETAVVGGQTVYRQRVQVAAMTGTWGYLAGASGSRSVGAGVRVIGIAAHSLAGGSMTINGGDSVPIPANSGIAIAPFGNLVAPAFIFTGTDSYFIETLT